MKTISFLFFFWAIGLGIYAQNITKAEYFVDVDKGIGKNSPITIAVPASDVTVPFSISLDTFKTGLHTLYVRTMDESKRWSIYSARIFQVMSVAETPNIVAAEYGIDTVPGVGKGFPIAIATPATSQTLAFTLNLTSASVGLHTMYVRVKNSNNIWSLANTRLFYIQDESEITKVVKFEYYFVGTSKTSSTFTFDGFEKLGVVELTDADFMANVNELEYGQNYTMYVRALSSNGNYSGYKTVVFTLKELGTNTGSERSSLSTLSIYPNPASDFIHLKNIDETHTLEYFLYNTLGYAVATGSVNNDRISLQNVSDGNYVLVLKDGDTLYKGKVIVKK